jgi:hydroxymethylbilane synthase
LATRGSPLALHQARHVAARLTAAAPGVAVDLVVVSTRGDRLAEAPLSAIGGEGVFVKEIQQAVLDGRADAAVHSAKDLPSRTPAELVIAAVPVRADPRDALVGSTLAELPPGGVVATGSARRRAQLANWRPDLTFVELRGNMAARLACAGQGSVHAVVVAMAALERLGWTDQAAEVLTTRRLLPQVGQGSIAVECRVDRPELVGLLGLVDDPWSHRTLLAERSLLAALGGDCAAPVAGWAEHDAGPGSGPGTLRLHGMVASGDGRVLVSAERSGPAPEALGAELARYLLEDCGGASIPGAPSIPDHAVP